jgi:xanthine/uracil/vitamin C permease (AzgA family)
VLEDSAVEIVAGEFPVSWLAALVAVAVEVEEDEVLEEALAAVVMEGLLESLGTAAPLSPGIAMSTLGCRAALM